MVAIIRTVLYAAVIVASSAVIFFPEARPETRPFAVPLYFVMGADMIVQSWRAGHLHKSFSELAKNPPRTGAVELMAYVLGAIAMALVL